MNIKDFDIDKYRRESAERERLWDALPEVEKERKRKSMAGLADRIEAENEAHLIQIKMELKAMTPE